MSAENEEEITYVNITNQLLGNLDKIN